MNQQLIKEIESLLNIKIHLENDSDEYYENRYFINNNNDVTRIIINKVNQIENYSQLSETLKKITTLESIDFSLGNIPDINFFTNVHSLEYIRLHGDRILSVSPLSTIKNLKTLDISGVKLTDKYSLSELKNIEELDISNCSISDLSVIKEINNLKRLDVRDNKIKDISTLKNLSQIEVLNLGSNQIEDISPLQNLTNLNSLWLINNKNIKNVVLIRNFTSLTSISIGYCDIKDLSFIENSINLVRLDAQDNKISDISSLKKLVNLKDINLSENEIHNITPLRYLKNISQLELQGNPITKLPKWITKFNIDIQWFEYGIEHNMITFFNNPFDNIPIEIIKQGKNAIERYFEKINIEGSEKIYEAKVTLVGEGSSGKTSLIRRLMNESESLPRRDNRTRGIKINRWKFDTSRNHIAHVWGFGGQDVYYPVHRFFITENSIFVLLASTRQSHHNFDYWIPTIYQFGDKSPIIIGQTCHDGNKNPWNDLGYYLGSEDFNIIREKIPCYYEINLPNKNYGLKKMNHYGLKVP